MKKLMLLACMLLVSSVSLALPPTPTWCSSRTNSYCTYAYDWFNACCYPTRISPGAFCPKICQ